MTHSGIPPVPPIEVAQTRTPTRQTPAPKPLLTYTGMETDLLFTQGVDLPHFASFPLLQTDTGRTHLRRYCDALIDLGARTGLGVILESATWVANAARAAPLGYDADDLQRINRTALQFLHDIRATRHHSPIVLSANIGPRDDAYAPADQMTANEAARYHSAQMAALADTDVDLVTAYTLSYPAEAIGIVQAARAHNLPVVISFTLETDGTLPNGDTLGAAITQVDVATDNSAQGFMINCAHPTHFADTLSGAKDAAWIFRLTGVVANASRCSHAELDAAETLDDGDPAEFGVQMAALYHQFPHLTVLGGCCGTDMRHLSALATSLNLPAPGSKPNTDTDTDCPTR